MWWQWNPIFKKLFFDWVTKFKIYIRIILCKVVVKYPKNIFYYHGFREEDEIGFGSFWRGECEVGDKIGSGESQRLSQALLPTELGVLRWVTKSSNDSNVTILNLSAIASRFVESLPTMFSIFCNDCSRTSIMKNVY